jgi:hypothetical protein
VRGVRINTRRASAKSSTYVATLLCVLTKVGKCSVCFLAISSVNQFEMKGQEEEKQCIKEKTAARGPDRHPLVVLKQLQPLSVAEPEDLEGVKWEREKDRGGGKSEIKLDEYNEKEVVCSQTLCCYLYKRKKHDLRCKDKT